MLLNYHICCIVLGLLCVGVRVRFGWGGIWAAGRTPLDERSARRIDLYLTTRNTQQTDIPAPPWDSKLQSQQANGRRPTPQTARSNASEFSWF